MPRRPEPSWRLKPEYRTAPGRWPGNEALHDWLTAECWAGVKGQHYISRLRQGEPVPESLVAGLAAYLTAHGDPGPVAPGDIADPAGVPPSVRGGRGRVGDLWRLGWTRVAAVLPAFAPPLVTEAHFARKRDIPVIAGMILDNLGRRVSGRGAAMDPMDARVAGQLALGLNLSDLTDWLRAWHDRDDRTVMFSVAGGVRVGSGSVLPLTEVAYRRLAAGGASIWDLAPAADAAVPSRYILANSVSRDWAVAPPVGPRRLGAAQWLLAMYQYASLTVPIDGRHTHPFVIAGDRNPENAERMKRYLFRPTGRRFDRPASNVLEMRPTDESDIVYASVYRVMVGLLDAYQLVVRS